MDQIPPEKIWISGMFPLHDRPAMDVVPITHVVSVLRPPLDLKLFTGLQHLVVSVDDVDDENLIEHFARTNDFITRALAGGGGLLVHCAMGKSRSATVLAAYLMKTRQLDAEAAVALIRKARSFVEPNIGFMEQLEIYHRMDYTVDLDAHPIYQRWLYQKNLELNTAAGRAPNRVHFRDAEQAVMEITNIDEGKTPAENGLVELRCKKCRRTLANSKFLTPHIPKALPTYPHKVQCSHHFLEPLSWMASEFEEQKLEGKLECPNAKCKSKVGSYSWHGMMCSCGEWVIPGISLARSKVDEAKVSVKL